MGVAKSGPDYGLITEKGLMGMFRQEHEEILGSGWAAEIGMRTESTQETETYRWMGLTPVMREWVGSRQAKGLRVESYKITNRPFELTQRFSVTDLRRDKINGLMPRVGDMARRAEEHWEKLITTLDLAGEVELCYDQLPFYSAAHVSGESGVQSNLLTDTDIPALEVVAAGNPTREEFIDIIIGGIQHFYGLKDDQGEPMNGGATEFLVMVPVKYFGVAVSAVSDRLTAAGSTNELANQRFKVKVEVNPRFPPAANSFRIYRTDGRGAKPFILQSELDVVMAVVGAGSEHEFNEDEWLFGLKASREVGFGLWQQALKLTLSTAT